MSFVRLAIVISFAFFLLSCKSGNGPSEDIIRAEIESHFAEFYKYNASVGALEFENFPDQSGGTGRTSVVGEFSLAQDLYASTDLRELKAALSPFGVNIGEARSIAQSIGLRLDSAFGQNTAEWQTVYKAGQVVTFSGEIRYLETAAGFSFNPVLRFEKLAGFAQLPDGGYLIGSVAHDNFIAGIVGIAQKNADVLASGRNQSNEDIETFRQYFSAKLEGIISRNVVDSMFLTGDIGPCVESELLVLEDEQRTQLGFECQVNTHVGSRCGNVEVETSQKRNMFYRVMLPHDRQNEIELRTYVEGRATRSVFETEGEWYACETYTWKDSVFQREGGINFVLGVDAEMHGFFVVRPTRE